MGTLHNSYHHYNQVFLTLNMSTFTTPSQFITTYGISSPLAILTVHELAPISNAGMILEHLFSDDHRNWNHFLSKFLFDERHKALCVLKDILIKIGSEACIKCWASLIEICQQTFSQEFIIEGSQS